MTDDLRRAMDDAHGTGLRQAGYDAALDDLSILLATEVELLEYEGDYECSEFTAPGIRWALRAIQEMPREHPPRVSGPARGRAGDVAMGAPCPLRPRRRLPRRPGRHAPDVRLV